MDLSLVLLALVVAGLVYLHLTSNYSYWKKQNVPHVPNPLPGFGHILPLFTLQDHLGTLLERFHRTMGKSSMYGCYVMRTPALVLRDPDLIKNVLQSNFASFRNNLLSVHEHADPILSKNPFFAKDELWTESRTMLSNNFSGKKMKGMLVIVLHVCHKLMGFINENCKDDNAAELEMKDLFSRVSAEVIANSAFGIEGQSFEDEPGSYTIINIAKKVFDPSAIRYIQQLILYFLPKLAKVMRIGIVPREANHFVKNHVKNFAKARLQSGEISSDFLQFSKEDLNVVDEDMMIAKATSILFDGYETTSSVLGFMVYRMSENLRVQDKARKEVLAVLERFDNKLTYEAVNNLDYLEQVMMETIRMHPAFGDITKICNKEITLEGYDKVSCHLKPKDIVLISIMGMHMDEEFWHNPTEFNPDRFNPENLSKVNKHAFLGFGAGPRVCPGKRMGTMIVKAVAAVLLKNYILEKSSRMEGPLKLSTSSFAAIVEDGLWVNFRPVKNHS